MIRRGPYEPGTWVDAVGDDLPDPVCDCGWPAWACDPRWHEEQDGWEAEHRRWQEANGG